MRFRRVLLVGSAVDGFSRMVSPRGGKQNQAPLNPPVCHPAGQGLQAAGTVEKIKLWAHSSLYVSTGHGIDW
jgi:hypothetical protein